MASMSSTTLVLSMAFSLLVAAGFSAPAPAVDCSSLVLNMADCLTFVTAGSTAKKPEGTCCSGLKTVLKTDAECLCEAFRNSAQLGVTLNITKAMTLPAACHVSAPSVTNCSLNNNTGAAPAEAPLAAPPTSVAEPPTPSIGANEVSPVPAPAPAKAGASSLLSPLALLVAAAALSSTLF